MRYRLQVPPAVPQGSTGILLGRGIASSLEFMDYREYQPGDDLRRVDWNALARSDKLTVKLYRDEIHPHVDLILDGSRSMTLAGSAKRPATLALAAALIEAAGNAGYRHTVWLIDRQCRQIPRGAEPPDVWEGIDFSAPVNPGAVLARYTPAWRTRGIRIFLSDLLWLGEPLETLYRLADRAAAVHVVQVLARADIEPPQRGNLRLVDSETGSVRDIFLDAAAQKRYRDKFTRHQQHWHRACRQVGATLTNVTAETFWERQRLDAFLAANILQVR